MEIRFKNFRLFPRFIWFFRF